MLLTPKSLSQIKNQLPSLFCLFWRAPAARQPNDASQHPARRWYIGRDPYRERPQSVVHAADAHPEISCRCRRFDAPRRPREGERDGDRSSSGGAAREASSCVGEGGAAAPPELDSPSSSTCGNKCNKKMLFIVFWTVEPRARGISRPAHAPRAHQEPSMGSGLERGHLRAALVDVRRTEARVDVYGLAEATSVEIV